MHLRLRGRIPLLATTIVGMLAGFAVVTPASGAPQGNSAPDGWKNQRQTATVTLITGDRVLVGTGPDGRPTVQPLASGQNGRRPTFRSWQSGDDVYVVPSDVARLVPTVLDSALFDVTALAKSHLDDAGSSTIPLLVRHKAGARAATSGPLRADRELNSIHATASRLDKRHATDLGASLAEAARAPKLPETIASGPLAGAQHVWLDAPVHPLLDPNLTQIDAPSAWNSGLSGTNVKVAVLDTGIDTAHPDLTGQVIASADFSGSADTGDHFGHGTHVAGIIAGTGVQSGNQRKGVAFGAKLLNGKVLGDNGSGTVSDAIAGMEWAASQGAKVANMSIGVDFPSDGTDPWSQAVNDLTASSGTLFVVAAGNTGQGIRQIGAPAAATAALTVGAVDGNNQPAVFSSSGPRVGDRAIKPEITAPGVGIISDRASGTNLDTVVDNNYVRASGTSMATPHVAGAAADLVQQHPDWTPAQLKAALVATSAPTSGVSVYVQGGGRVDLGHLVNQKVFSDLSTVDFKSVAANASATGQTVTLRNTGTTAVTVSPALSVQRVDGSSVPAGLFTVSPATLSLPAGGSGTVTVTVHPSSTATGEYSGGLTLTPSSGRALRLPVGAFVTPPSVTVQVSGIDRNGNPDANGELQLWNVDDAAFNPTPDPGNPGGIPLDANGQATVTLVAGRYSTMSLLDTPGVGVTLVGAAETTINQNGPLVLDARTAQPVTTSVDGLTNPQQASVLFAYSRTDKIGRPLFISFFTGGPAPLFASPTPPVTAGRVETELLQRLDGTIANGPAEVTLPFVEAGFRNPPTYHVSASELASYAQVAEDYRSFGTAALDYGVGQGVVTPLRGSFVGGSTGLTFPLKRTDYFRPDNRLTFFQCVIAFVVQGPPVDEICESNATAHPAGERASKQWLTAPFDPTIAVTRTTDQINFTAASPFGDGDGRFEAITPVIGVTQNSFQVSRDGVPISGGSRPVWVPTDRPSTIRVDGRFDLDPNLTPLPSSTQVSWTFSTQPPTGSTPVVPPVWEADVRLPGLDTHNQAAAGQPLAVEVNPHTIPGATAGLVGFVNFFVSPDNGTTWNFVNLTRGADGIYRGTITGDQVRSGGSIGLRVSSGDTQGDSVDQTQLTAVRVTG